MSQPHMAVQPNPAAAAVLRKVKINPDHPAWTALFEFEISVLENGITLADAPNHLPKTVDALVAAQLETIVVLTNLQNGLLGAAEGVKDLIYKKKDAPANDAMKGT